MTSKFEQLIEYVINDEEAKAKELFHDIVVEKSREIYENLMNEESDAEEDDHAERAAEKVKKDIEYDDAEDKKERADEDFGGDSSENLMKEVETDQMGESDDADAEFEALLGDEEVATDDAEFDMEPVDGEVGGDAYVDDDTSEFQDVPMSENVDLKAAPKPVTTEPAGTNTRSTTAFNSGAAGMASKPVKNTATEANPDGTASYKAPTSYADKGRGNLPGAGSFKNVPGKDNSKLAPATKPTLTQAAGVNTKTPFPKG